ncbi:Scavenger receptor class B member 1 [Papilio xuthus]|uniref:Scavenger receptor class B member 1 n=1 Tax=Papilio xuthus TaxID=66420 RepID=A0A194Q1W4_PAPXU|nr:Scavenger receptor class B member 1 [Papilio xuthus]
MKPAQKCNTLTKANRKKLVTRSTLGVALVALAVTALVVDPVVLIAKYQLKVTPGTEMYRMLTSEIEGAYVSAYLFNISNAEAFLSGADSRLRVHEVGPFTYQEKRYNTHFEVDEKAQVLRYRPFINVTFMPEMSVAEPADVNVTVGNTALLAIATAMSSHPFWSQLALNLLTRRYKSRAVVTLPVHDLLWGHHEPLLAFGHKLMPGWINFEQLGLLDRLYDNTREYQLELSLEDQTKFQVRRVNGHAGLTAWSYNDPNKRSRCNTFEDAYEGFSYPAGLTPERPIRLYRNVFCRMLEVDFSGTKTLDYGPELYVYKLSNRTFTKNPDTECLCSAIGCKDGLSDLSPCFYSLPVMMSNAHFYGAPAEVYARIDGIAPDEQKHGGVFAIDQKLGSALQTSMTFQLNVPVADVTYNKEARSFANITVPIAYFKVTQPEVPDHVKTLFWLVYVLGPYAVYAVAAGLAAAGLGLLATAACLLSTPMPLTKQAIARVQVHCELPLIKHAHKQTLLSDRARQYDRGETGVRE